MPNFNQVTICGRIGRDPETRNLPSGASVTSFSMALTEKWKDKQSGERQERTSWVDVEAFGRSGEVIAQYFHKGSHILIAGRLREDKWEKDGVKRSKLKVVADTFEFIDDTREQNQQQGGNQQQQRQQQQRQPDYQTDGPAVDESDIPF